MATPMIGEQTPRPDGRRIARAALYGLVLGAVITFGVAIASIAVTRMRTPLPSDLIGILSNSAFWAGIVSVATGIVAAGAIAAWRLLSPAQGWRTAVLVLAVIGFLVFVWPTPWVYREFGCTVVKVTRLTGYHDEPIQICAASGQKVTPGP
jgi:hypothetical protein